MWNSILWSRFVEVGNEFARNVLFFSVDNSSSSRTDNRKNNFLVLVKGPTNDINGSLGTGEKTFCINLVKQRQNFAQFCFKVDNENVSFPSQFYLGIISEKWGYK